MGLKRHGKLLFVQFLFYLSNRYFFQPQTLYPFLLAYRPICYKGIIVKLCKRMKGQKAKKNYGQLLDKLTLNEAAWVLRMLPWPPENSGSTNCSSMCLSLNPDMPECEARDWCQVSRSETDVLMRPHCPNGLHHSLPVQHGNKET